MTIIIVGCKFLFILYPFSIPLMLLVSMFIECDYTVALQLAVTNTETKCQICMLVQLSTIIWYRRGLRAH
jgi:hypothetical protein